MNLSERSRFQIGVFLSCFVFYSMVYGIVLVLMDILFHLISETGEAFAIGSTLVPYSFGAYGIHLLAESLTKVLFD